MMAARTCCRLLGRSRLKGAEYPRRTGISRCGVMETGQVDDVKDYKKIPSVGHPNEVSENFDTDLTAEATHVPPLKDATLDGSDAPGCCRVTIILNKETKTGACRYRGPHTHHH
uniref:Uncharacterized protein n=1 Tax=Canis lupus dingo TaxID=286419 RepID=A0A8C0LPH1_CANLU